MLGITKASLATDSFLIRSILPGDHQGSASAAEEESRAAEEKQAYLASLPDMGAIYGIAVNGVGWSHFFADNSYSMAPANFTSQRSAQP